MSPKKDTLLPSEEGVHQHLLEGTGVTMLGGDMNEEREIKVEPVSWEVNEPSPNKKDYLMTSYSQFSNIIMISTFTGGVQAAILAFMNDLLSGEAIKVQLFHQDEANSGRHIYSAYSLGLMLGLLSIILSLTVAVIAAVNATLACHFSLHRSTYKPQLEARILFCMLLQLVASSMGGISLVMLCTEFDLAFTIVAAVLFFAGIAISAFHLICLLLIPPSQWLRELKRQPLHVLSLLLSTVTFCFDVSSPSQSTWLTITAFGATVIFHVMAVLCYRLPLVNRSRRRYVFLAVAIACMWVGRVLVTVLVSGFQRYEGRSDVQEQVSRYVIASSASVEALVLLAIGGAFWVEVARKIAELRERGV